jgi:hypothetical protein
LLGFDQTKTKTDAILEAFALLGVPPGSDQLEPVKLRISGSRSAPGNYQH